MKRVIVSVQEGAYFLQELLPTDTVGVIEISDETWSEYIKFLHASEWWQELLEALLRTAKQRAN